MPNPQYYIELDNSTVASFDTSSSTAEGLMFGSTEVKLKGHSILICTLDCDNTTVLLSIHVWCFETDETMCMPGVVGGLRDGLDLWNQFYQMGSTKSI